jgi:hypothetical protein
MRRRHNYLPFVFSLLGTLAQKGQLEGLVEQARKRDQDRKETKRSHNKPNNDQI